MKRRKVFVPFFYLHRMKHNIIKSVAVLLFSLLPAISFAHDFEVNGIYYKITSSTDKTVDVTYMGDQSSSAAYIGTVDIPSSVSYQGNMYTVTGIGENAFSFCKQLTQVVIPNSVTAIKDFAFSNCPLLSRIIIPSSVNSIHIGSFINCYFADENFINLSPLSSSGSRWNAKIYNNSTEENGLIIQNGVTLVKARENITSANISNTITSIGENAFENCKDLNSIDIPNSVTSIGGFAFYNSGINHEIIVNNIYAYAPTNVTAVTIPSGVTHINGGAFRGCFSLSSVSIPESVTSIGEWAFDRCVNLTSINIPESVTSIGEDAFIATGITRAEFASIESLCKIDFENDFSNPLCHDAGGHLYINGREVTDVVIPEGITNLYYTFCGAKYITSVTIPNTVTSIDNAFCRCEKLTSVAIPKGVTSMNAAFVRCTGLQSVTIPNSVVYMNDAFHICENLTSITIPASVKELDRAFINCTKLNSVTNLAATPQNCNETIFHNIPNSCVLHVLPGSVEAYEANVYWSYCMKTIVGDAVILDFDIVDGADNEFSNASDMNLETITYTRNFKNTNWQPLYVPFSMSFSDWDALGLEVARINGFYEYDDDENGTIDRSALEVLKVKSGELRPNHPYLVRAKTTGERTITLNDAMLYATESNSIDCSTIETKYTFTGIYERMTAEELGAMEAYVMGGGSLGQSTTALNPFRWYMVRESRGGQLMSASKRIQIIVWGEDDPSGILDIDAEDVDAPIYNVAGQRVSNSARGIVIKNGKKYVVK